MSLIIEYQRPYERHIEESLQNIIIKYFYRNIKWMYPKTIFAEILCKHAKMFVPYTAECEYQLDYICKDKGWGIATIYLDPLIRSNRKIKELERDGYKFRKIDKLTITTYNSIGKFHPKFFRDRVPKSMLLNKILQLIDKNLNNFKHWGCEFNCVDQPYKCENNNPVTRHVCYKLYS